MAEGISKSEDDGKGALGRMELKLSLSTGQTEKEGEIGVRGEGINNGLGEDILFKHQKKIGFECCA